MDMVGRLTMGKVPMRPPDTGLLETDPISGRRSGQRRRSADWATVRNNLIGGLGRLSFFDALAYIGCI